MLKPNQGIVPRFARILDLCSSSRKVNRLREIHAKAIINGTSQNDFIRAKLVSSYAACFQLREAQFIFSLTNRQSTFLYNTLIRGFSSANRLTHSLSLFLQMLRAGKSMDVHTLPAVLKCCGGLPALRLGRQVHAAAIFNGFASDSAHSNALITMYSKSGDLVGARRVFDEMPYRNAVSWSAMMDGYGMHGMFREVFCLFNGMVDAGVLPDQVTFTTVLSACVHGGLADEGIEYFEMMHKRFGLKPVLEHFTCMVDMLGRAGRVEEAKALVQEMDEEPDDALWGALLGACKTHGKVELAEEVAERMWWRRLISVSSIRYCSETS